MVKHKEHIIPNKQFVLLMTEVLKKGKVFRFQASGFSMDPFIKDGDILTLIAADPQTIRLGDVLAFNYPSNGKLTVHRVVNRRKNRLFIKPDNSISADGWIGEKDVIGVVQSVERSETNIRFGMGWERHLIARLSRFNLLTATIHNLWRFFPPQIKRKVKG